MNSWTDHGLTASGAEAADKLLPLALALAKRAKQLGCLDDGGVIRAVLDEAKFRVHELPKRTAEFQRKYRAACLIATEHIDRGSFVRVDEQGRVTSAAKTPSEPHE